VGKDSSCLLLVKLPENRALLLSRSNSREIARGIRVGNEVERLITSISRKERISQEEIPREDLP